MPWFKLKGDARLGCCVSESCWGQPTYRLEAGGTGSNYCSGCRDKIEAAELEAKYGTVVPGVHTPGRGPKMKTYLFFRDRHFYPVEEESDEKILKHVPLNPGTTKIETIEGQVIYRAPTVQ